MGKHIYTYVWLYVYLWLAFAVDGPLFQCKPPVLWTILNNEEVLRFWPQSDVSQWNVINFTYSIHCEFTFSLGMSTTSDIQTGHSNVKERDKGPSSVQKTLCPASQLRIFTCTSSLSCGLFHLRSSPESSRLFMYGGQVPTILILLKMTLPWTVALGYFSPF